MSDIIKNMFSKGREAEVVEEVAAVDNSNNNPVNNNLMDVNFWNQVASKLRKLEQSASDRTLPNKGSVIIQDQSQYSFDYRSI